MIYDISNACLGVLNGMVQVANMIELGQIRAGIVVGTECGRQLVENTIAHLNSDHSLTRESVKNSIASLTIGSASVAVVLCDEELSETGNRLSAAAVHCDTTQHELCQSRGLETFMQTDSEELMKRGIAAGAETFADFLATTGWERDDINRTFCHQVGVSHRKLMFEALQLDPAIDFTTIETLGNTGSAALPVTMALGIEHGRVRQGDRIAMLGIGSGINCLMLAAKWQSAPVAALSTPHKVAGVESAVADAHS
jgi:3-oxoacyl-[acyl-carrier-protein] synthase-3